MAENDTKQISVLLFLARDMGDAQVTDIKPVAERDEEMPVRPVSQGGSEGGVSGTGFMTPDGRYPIIRSRSVTASDAESTTDDKPNRNKRRVEHASLAQDGPKGGLLGRLKSGGAGGGDGGDGYGTPTNPGSDPDSGLGLARKSVMKRAVAGVLAVCAVALAVYGGWLYLFSQPSGSASDSARRAENQGSAAEEPNNRAGQGSLGMDVPKVTQGEKPPTTAKAFGTPPPVDTSEPVKAKQTLSNEPGEEQTLEMSSVKQATTLGGSDVPQPEPSNAKRVNLTDEIASDVDLSVSDLGNSSPVPETGINEVADPEAAVQPAALSQRGRAEGSGPAVASSYKEGSGPELKRDQSSLISGKGNEGEGGQPSRDVSPTMETAETSRLENQNDASVAPEQPKRSETLDQSVADTWNSDAADYSSSTISSITHSGRLLSRDFNAEITDDSRPRPSVDSGALKATIGRLRAELTQVRRERNRIEAELDAKPDSLSYPGWHVMGTTGHDSAVLVGPSDRTRIVRTGDALWGSTVTEIDPNRQVVRTHDGIIQAGP